MSPPSPRLLTVPRIIPVASPPPPQGLGSSVAEVRAVALDTIAKVCKATRPEALRPHLGQLVQSMLEGLSSLEDSRCALFLGTRDEGSMLKPRTWNDDAKLNNVERNGERNTHCVIHTVS